MTIIGMMMIFKGEGNKIYIAVIVLPATFVACRKGVKKSVIIKVLKKYKLLSQMSQVSHMGGDKMFKITGQYIGIGGQVKNDECLISDFKQAWKCREEMLEQKKYIAVCMVMTTEGGIQSWANRKVGSGF